jgi:L-arabinonolactonase
VADELTVVAHDRAIVGESPAWSVRERALYWLDGRSDAIYRLDPLSGARATWSVPSRVNALAPADAGLVVAMKSGISLLDTQRGTFAQIAAAPFVRADMRMNDAKTDRAGRLWFGTMHEDGAEPIGALYHFDGGAPVEIDAGYTVPNGFAWSADDRRMYVADSRLKTIFAYDFDLASGAATNRRPFAVSARGSCDGATIDSAGYLWSACPGGFALARYAPDGNLDRLVELPVERPTSVAFGGADLRTLFVTTATRAIPGERLATQPWAGAVLALRVDVPGLPEPAFRAR